MPKLVTAVRKQKYGKFIRGRERYADKNTVSLEVDAQKVISSTKFSMAGIDWVLSTDRYEITENDVQTSYVAVKIEPQLPRQKVFRIKANGSLRIRHNPEKISQMAFNADSTPEVAKDFAVMLSPTNRFHLEKRFILQSKLIGKKSPLTNWGGKFIVELELNVVSIVVSQFPDTNFKARTSPSQIQVQVSKKTEKNQAEPGASDVVSFYCTKEVLAFHSEHFKTLFFSEGAEGFAENRDNCIKLKCEDISPKAFKNFLQILHACETEVSAEHVEELLGFAKYSLCPLVTGHCESFLLSRKAHKIGIDYKLQLADIFKLHTLRANLIRRLMLKDHIETLLESTKQKKITLDDETIAMLRRRADQLPTREQRVAAWTKKRAERAEKRKRAGKKGKRGKRI